MPRRPALDGCRESLNGVTIVLGPKHGTGKVGRLHGSRRRPGRESASEAFRPEVFFFGTSSGDVRFSEGMTRVRIDFA
jgi:hypothetical protein